MTAPPDDFALQTPTGVPGGSEGNFPNQGGVRNSRDELPGS
jgi:hypothetical protein